jgi:hypothetical protein
MKRISVMIILGLILVISVTTKARAEGSDPKTNQMIQGAGSLVGAAMATIAGLGYIAPCMAPPPAQTGIPCAMMVMAFTAATMQLGISGYSFATAGSLSSEEGTNSTDIFGSKSALPPDGNFNHLPDSSDPTSTSREAVLKNMDKLQAQIEDLKSRGILTDEIIANPEKLLTPEQLDGFNAEKEKLMAELTEGNSDSELALETLFEGSESDGSAGGDPAGGGFQTASLTSPFASAFDSIEGLLDLKKKGIQNSAPGYYGNVSLKSLRPESKMSLFERVSLKIKQVVSGQKNMLL